MGLPRYIDWPVRIALFRARFRVLFRILSEEGLMFKGLTSPMFVVETTPSWPGEAQETLAPQCHLYLCCIPDATLGLGTEPSQCLQWKTHDRLVVQVH